MKKEKAERIEMLISGQKSNFTNEPSRFFVVDRQLGDFYLRLFDDGWTIMNREGVILVGSVFKTRQDTGEYVWPYPEMCYKWQGCPPCNPVKSERKDD